MRRKTGNERIRTLFREIQGRAIHRDIIEAVAQQKDYMKRLRKNGGARDALAREGIAILSGNFDTEIIKRLGIGPVARDEFISFQPVMESDRTFLRSEGKID
jgi:hypothetical protein